MITSNKHKFIFIHVHKVAGQSVTNALMPFAVGSWQRAVNPVIPYRIQLKLYTKLKQYSNNRLSFLPQPYADHIRGPVMREIFGADLFDQYFSFAFVRNPWDWVLSLYTYAKSNPRHRKHALVNRFNSFRDYCLWHCNDNPNIKFQKDYIFDENNQKVLSFIGKQENLQADFRYVCEQIGINATLPHYNVSRASELDLHYTDELYQLVADRFAADIKILGYSNYLEK